MKVADARKLAQYINDACDAAEKVGGDEITLINALQAADDLARSELQAAIDAAQNVQG